MRKREFETERGALRYWVSENDEETAQLVFLPGLTADHRLFNKQVDYFSQRARCLVWDPPSHHVVFYRLRGQKLGQLQKLTLTQGVEFHFLPQRAWWMVPANSTEPKTPVLNLNCPLARKPPAATTSESSEAACPSFAKPQVAGLRHRQEKEVVSDGLPMSWRTGLEIPLTSGNASSSLELSDSL